MRVSVSNKTLNSIKTDLLVVPLTKEEFKLKASKKGKKKKSQDGGSTFSALGARLKGALREKLEHIGFKAEAAETSLFTFPGESRWSAILLVGWAGDLESRTFERCAKYRKLGALIVDAAKKHNLKKVALLAGMLELENSEALNALLEGLSLGGYEFTKYKSKVDRKFLGISEFALMSNGKISTRTVSLTTRVCEATMLARDLVNTPPRDCTPRVLVQVARDVAKKGKLEFKLYEKEALRKMGANALLAVAQGSSEPPFLIRMAYAPKKPTKTIAVVGKGVTFDSGGLSIKTGSGMETMKMDMAGAAAVIGVMQVISAIRPEVEVRGYIPTVENMISGAATRPGDVVKALNGKTIEILNTDAEGRLILADALSLAVREKPDVIIDLATLTGACVVALGSDYAGLFTSDDDLAEDLTEAGDLSGERLWRMPLAAEYKELIKSSVADIRNIGGQWGGAITAALFLQEFVAKTPWAHIDLAGPAFSDSDKGHVRKGGVGFGVRTVVRYILGGLEGLQ